MHEKEKELAALGALCYINSEMTIGLGSGSTASYFIEHLGSKVESKELSNIRCVATSEASAELAKKVGLDIISLDQISTIDITVDGADEFDPYLNLIKGGGGALVREKIVASISKQLIIIVDSRKEVRTLGGFKLPLEVMKFSYCPIFKKLDSINLNPVIRTNTDGTLFISDNNNYIIDLSLGKINNLHSLDELFKNTPGIIDNGLFIDMANKVIMGSNGTTIEYNKAST